MRRINFTKMVASGNDFVILEKNKLSVIPALPAGRRYPLSAIAKQICNRRFGIGADGLLLLDKSKVADARMRIFNPDGSEAEMCGNGARCTALYAGRGCRKIKTQAGIIETKVARDSVRIKLTDPTKLKLNIPLKVNGRRLKVNFINTGVPHAVIFAEGLEKIDVVTFGRQVRYHQSFAPAGTNVDFVEILSKDSIGVRAYERGVEDETLACGTGSVAAALLTAYSLQLTARRINVHTRSGEILKVYFDRIGNNFKNVWLEGKAKIVYRGEYYV